MYTGGTAMKEGQRRIYLLDELRGFAIICMVFHHMFYDIGFVLHYDIGYKIFNYLCVFQPFFWAIFIITSGVCSRLSRNTVRRGIIVFAAGLAVTLVTAVIMPAIGITGAEIYFGVLSCLGISMIITGIFMPLINKLGKKGSIAGMAVSAVLFLITYSVSEGSLFFGLVELPQALYSNNICAFLGFHNGSFFSADYFPLIPWLFMFLFGAFLGKWAKDGALPKAFYKSRVKFFQKAGKNSLWIYLLHQPALYAVMYLISFIQLLSM